MKLVCENINDILKPKSEEEITNRVYDVLASNFYQRSMGLIKHLHNLKFLFGIANNYVNHKYEINNNIKGLYILFPDHSDALMERILSKINLNIKKIGNTTYIIDNDEKEERLLIKLLLEEMFNDKLDWFHLKKFI